MQSLPMLSTIVLITIASISATPVSPPLLPSPFPNPCECTNLTIKSFFRGRDVDVGNCLTKQGGKYFCYIRSTDTSCFDQQESSNVPGLFWSTQGCPGNDDFGPLADPISG